MNIFKKKGPSENSIIIGVCGKSCSGKSRVTRKIAEKFNEDVCRINSDRFFKIYNVSELNQTDGWESPNSIRFDRLIYSVKKLKSGKSTHIPSHGWTEIFDQEIYPKKIIIVEGYLIFTNKELVDLFDLKIFVDVSDINILYRRLKREGNIDSIDYIMEKVIPIGKKYEKIQRDCADIIIDGNKSKDEVLKETEKIIKKYLS